MFSLESLVSGLFSAFGSTAYEIAPDSSASNHSYNKKSQQTSLPQDQEYAAPWEMPPLLCEKVSLQRDRALRVQALALSKSKHIWIQTCEPTGDSLAPKDFQFCFDYSAPFAIKALRLDDNLKDAYCEFVPNKMDEKMFWRQYFWHIELLKCEVTDRYQGVAIDIEETKEESTAARLKRVPSFANQSFCPTPQLVFHLPRRSVIVREYLRYRLRELKSIGRDHSSSVDFEPCTYELTNSDKKNKGRRRVKFDLPDAGRFLRLENVPLAIPEVRERCKSM